jgi:hypothetical protein
MILPTCVLGKCTFDLGILKGTHNVFVVVLNVILKNWETKHVKIGLFDVYNIISITMALQFQ